MPDVARSLPNLQTLLADNASGDISAQDMRDVLVSTYPSQFVVKNAVANGVTDDTAAIQAEVDACYAAGGGEVLIPAGNYGVTSITRNWTGPVRVSIRGENGTTLTKIGISATPIFDFSASTLQTPYLSISNLHIIGNAKGHNGINLTLLARLEIDRCSIAGCDVAIENIGSLIFSCNETWLNNNNIGYRCRKSSSPFVYCNLVQFYGGGMVGNTSFGADLGDASGVHFYGSDFELNGTAANLGTGAVMIRSTVDDEAGLSNMSFNGCWFESNLGMTIQTEAANQLVLSIRSTNLIGSESGNVMNIGVIKHLKLDNIFASSVGDTITSNATRTLISGSTIYDYVDNSTTTKINLADQNGTTTFDTPGVAGGFPITAIETAQGLVTGDLDTRYEPGNVLRYGADPTGVADSTAAFNLATRSDYQSTGNSDLNFHQDVIVPQGQYIITDSVFVHKGQHIRGAGEGATRIDLTGTSALTTPVFRLGAYDDGLTGGFDIGGLPPEISGMWLEGGPSVESVIFTGAAGVSIHNLFLTSPGPGIEVIGNDSRIFDIQIDQGGQALILAGHSHIITNVLMYSMNYCIEFIDDAADIVISDCQCYFTKFASVRFRAGVTHDNIIFNNLQFSLNVQTGTFGGFVRIESTNATNIVFNNATFRNMLGSAIITVAGSSGNEFTFNNPLFDGDKTVAAYAQSTTAYAAFVARSTVRFNNPTFRNLLNETIFVDGGTSQTRVYVEGGTVENCFGTDLIDIATTAPLAGSVLSVYDVTYLDQQMQPFEAGVAGGWFMATDSGFILDGNGGTTVAQYPTGRKSIYFVNTSSLAASIRLPQSTDSVYVRPKNGDQLTFIDYGEDWATNNVTFERGDNTIEGATSNLVASTNGDRITLTYNDAVSDWTSSSVKSIASSGVEIPVSAAEATVGATIVNSNYEVGNVLRYGTNTTPGTTDMTAAIQAAIDVIYTQGGGDVIIPAGDYGVTALSREWIGLNGLDVTCVNIRGQGKTASILRKIGATTTPILRLHALNVQSPAFFISDIELIGNAKGHNGIQCTLLSRLAFHRVSIYQCDIGFYSEGTQLSTFKDCTFTANNTGYEATSFAEDNSAAIIQPNAMQFYGGEIRTNTSWGVDLLEGDLTTFHGTNFERNGTASTSTTGAIIVRGTIDVRTTYPTVELDSCFFESNRGGNVIQAEASNLTLSLKNIHMYSPDADGNVISIAAISMLRLDHYAAYGTGAAVTSAAINTVIIGGRLGTYTDNSTTTFISGSMYTESISATGSLSDTGQVGTFAFLSASSGLANVGAFNYDAVKTEPLKLFCSHVQLPTATDTVLNDITNVINTDPGKLKGAMVFNSTQNIPVYAVGGADGSVWVDGAGTTVNTPV